MSIFLMIVNSPYVIDIGLGKWMRITRPFLSPKNLGGERRGFCLGGGVSAPQRPSPPEGRH
jgi:hypothetical protein